MAEQAEQVSSGGVVDTKQPKRRQYSEALKRQMLAETKHFDEAETGARNGQKNRINFDHWYKQA